MKLLRRQFLHLAAGAAALPAVSRFGWAHGYPSRPIRIISGFAPGGVNDTYARLMGQWLSERRGSRAVSFAFFWSLQEISEPHFAVGRRTCRSMKRMTRKCLTGAVIRMG